MHRLRGWSNHVEYYSHDRLRRTLKIEAALGLREIHCVTKAFSYQDASGDCIPSKACIIEIFLGESFLENDKRSDQYSRWWNRSGMKTNMMSLYNLCLTLDIAHAPWILDLCWSPLGGKAQRDSTWAHEEPDSVINIDLSKTVPSITPDHTLDPKAIRPLITYLMEFPAVDLIHLDIQDLKDIRRLSSYCSIAQLFSLLHYIVWRETPTVLEYNGGS